MKTTIDVDVMVNEGRTFYGRVVAEVPTLLSLKDGKESRYVAKAEIDKVILQKFPTLKNQKYQFFLNKKNGI